MAEPKKTHKEDLSTPFASMLSMMREQSDRAVERANQAFERTGEESRRYAEEGQKLLDAQSSFGREMADVWQSGWKRIMDAAAPR